MAPNFLDYSVCIGFFALMALIGVVSSFRAGKNSSEFYLSGRQMPWWLLGFSLVATTFAADTPNFVANVVRTQGVAGNWCWWAFLLLGVVFAALSLFCRHQLLSIFFGVTAFSAFWGIGEVFAQHKRVKKGWFPMNPKRKADYE